jgi:putative phosphoserine phosphatase / 1-acylglycerol-3-phosphate O-acyltransferase
MAKEAAIFDLDRTLLAGASGPIITSALKAAGLMPDRTIPGEDLIFRAFNLIGENRPAMMLTRQAARLANGWSRARAQEAGRVAAEKLIGDVQPYARVLIEQHRAAGRLVAIATTTPYDMVEPLAAMLGVEHVIATRYGERNGTYDGTIDGSFVWGRGKLTAVQQWVRHESVALEDCYAYSDSFYDAALLGAVGHPYVVNPDPRMRIVAVARRWPTIYLDVPPGVPKFAGIEPQRALMMFTRPELARYVRLDISGTGHLPVEGPAIICANHRSYYDPAALGFAFAQRGRPVRFLGKKEVFDAPIVGDMARAMGGIRVERGTGSDEPLQEAAAALEAGELVAIMPQGTIPRGRAFFEPTLQGRWGAARLAAMTKAPVIPIGLWGTEKVWPRNARVPNLLNITHPPEVRVRVGTPVKLTYSDLDDDTARIMGAITKLLPPEARRRHKPTAEELARTMPPGFDPDAAESAAAVDPAHGAESAAAVDPAHEQSRRPGLD